MAELERSLGSVGFGPFELSLETQELRKHGVPLKLSGQAIQVLEMLTAKPGKLVTREELQKKLWPAESFGDFEHGLNAAVNKLREKLGDSATTPTYIETLSGRGYRFIAEVQLPNGIVAPEPEPAAVEPEPPKPGWKWKAAFESTVAHEQKASAEPRNRRLLAPGLVAAAIGVLVAGFFFLRIIGKSYRASPGVGHWVAEQRVTANPPETPVHGAVVSPDGKYIVYADTTLLYLRQISTGEVHPWPLPKGFVAWPNSWFPDGTHLLAVRPWPEGATEGWKPSLWKLSLLGGPPQKIMDEAAGGSVSPDGTRIAYVPILPGRGDSNELRVMDSDGENVRTVASAKRRDQPGWIYPEVWSPYGQRLAYIERHLIAAPHSGDRPAISIRTTNADGSASTVVLDDPRIGPALWWVPDGRILYAYRQDPAPEGNDNYGIYSIQVDERTGRAIGQPRQITNAEGFVSVMSASSDGRRLVLWRENASWQVFITELNPMSRQWTTPRRLTLDTNHHNEAGAWTADSKAVLFVSNRDSTFKLFKQNIDETTPEVLVEGRSIYLPRSSADGSQVLYLAGSKPDDTSLPASLMSKPLAGGPARLVLQERGIINYECARAPSKLCVFSKLVGSDLIFVSFDLEQGAGSELARTAGLDPGSTSGYTKWGLSPDGSRLALVMDRHRIRFLALDTGVAHDVSVNDWPLFDPGWSADSKSLFMQSRTSKGAAATLEVNEAGKVEVAIEGKADSDFLFFIQSPDGRHGILEMKTPGDNNAWMVDNF
jgi:DNA-binding winged helix-turn-helix (wHTH) protein/Tol biopolymer transport system component